jgi:asparagine synthase (glutamine-hydrolysing)
MCGIAGIIGTIGESNRTALRKMSAAMSHRGPDGEGFWEEPSDDRGWGLMLAHRRLSILDLSTAAAQPMVDSVKGDVVVLNGEIYNYIELRNKLASEGQTFLSSGDTVVMLRTLSLNGHRAIASLRGMFAFAFWQSDERRLILARDPFGIKPLYFARNRNSNGDWSLVFASEVRAILRSGLLGKPRLNPLAAASVAWNGFMVAPETAISEIESVWPGQFVEFDSAGHELRSEHYWSACVSRSEEPISESSLATTLEDCVRIHLASDVPLGVFLSSGVDSSTIANLAQRASASPIHTFTLAFELEQLNEGPTAKRIAKAIGTQHQEVVLTEQHFIAQLDSALNSLDQPTFDGLNSYFMSQAVRDAGFKVALVGTGGDELFGGYTSFRDLPALLRWSRHTRWMPAKLRLALASLISIALQPSAGKVPQQTRWAKLPEMVGSGEDLLALYQMAYALFLPTFQRQLLTHDIGDSLVAGLPRALNSHLRMEMESRQPLPAISVLEHRLFLGERLLRDTDAASMAASIEVRLPLVDHILFESVDRLPLNNRFLPLRKKAILRRIGLRQLDQYLFEKPKSGFVLPYDRWIKMNLGKLMDGTMRDPLLVKPTGLNPDIVLRLWKAFLDGAPGIYWSRVWAVYVFIRWCHQHEAYL